MKYVEMAKIGVVAPLSINGKLVATSDKFQIQDREVPECTGDPSSGSNLN